jgi:hypothetical protein
VAIETYATEHNGGYAGVTSPADLKTIEPTINTTPGNSDAYLSSATGTSSAYTIVSVSEPTADQFTVVNNAGVLTRSCSGSGGGCTGGSW